MSLMSGLHVGATGLRTSQNALNTVAHNLSNVETEGYTRQQVSQSDNIYNTISYQYAGVSRQQVGLGVYFSETKRVRDVFLDRTYRQENGRSSFYEVQAEAIEEIEDIIGEMQGEEFEQALVNLWETVQELAKDPTSSVNQSAFVRRAAQFIERSNAVYSALSDYQDDMNLTVKNQVDKINEYGQKIKELNDKIVSIEAAGVEKANDLQDERDYYLDELSSLANITYSEDSWGYVNVKLEGVDFIKNDMVYEVALETDDETGFYTPYWKQLANYTLDHNGNKVYHIEGAEVFDLLKPIQTELNTDIGSLKGILLARGDHRATFEDLQDSAYYNASIDPSIMMKFQAEFDQLVSSVVTSINDVLANAANASDGYLWDAKQNAPLQIFVQVSPDTGSALDKGWITSNIDINTELVQQPGLLGFMRSDGKADYDTTEALAMLFEEQKYYLNPNTTSPTTFTGYYTDMVSQLANEGSVYKSISTTQQQTALSAENARTQVVGVSSDEELQFMIMFQNAYNASSRYINALSEMLGTLINTMGA